MRRTARSLPQAARVPAAVSNRSDPGATSRDALDGYLPQSLARSVGDLGPVDSAVATAPGIPYVILYNSVNGGGMTAVTATRQVAFAPPLSIPL